MKIDESCINHNAVRLIDEIEPWDISGTTDISDSLRIIILGYIHGVTDMAEALKEVLKA